MGLKTVYIGLGSNLGDRVLALDATVTRLKTVEDTQYIALSGIYETSPVGVGGGLFLNAVAVMETGLGPEVLLKVLLSMETARGRVREQGEDRSRNIDLDLLLFANTVVEEKKLTVPHPLMLHRRFIMEPLAELAPDLKIPPSGITASEAASDLAIQHPEQIIRRLGTLEELKESLKFKS
jgi:2-amino-4-hydroxy-6-hydroxymethyldihydropteridine diphosphokinase